MDQKAYAELVQLVKEASASGKSNEEILSALRSEKMADADIKAVMREALRPADVASVKARLASVSRPGELVFETKPSMAPAIFKTFFGSLFLGAIIALFIFNPFGLLCPVRYYGLFGYGPAIEPSCRVITVILSGLFYASMISIFKLLKIRSRVYSIYEDRIEWYEGFITLNKRTVYLNRITDIGSRRGILDRIFGTGTIGISTAGSHGPEVLMQYMRNMDSVYDRLRELWKAKVGSNPPRF